jgi:hypothetical protein
VVVVVVLVVLGDTEGDALVGAVDEGAVLVGAVVGAVGVPEALGVPVGAVLGGWLIVLDVPGVAGGAVSSSPEKRPSSGPRNTNNNAMITASTNMIAMGLMTPPSDSSPSYGSGSGSGSGAASLSGTNVNPNTLRFTGVGAGGR